MKPIEYMSYKRDHGLYGDPLISKMRSFFDPKLQPDIMSNLKYPIILHYKLNGGTLYEMQNNLGEINNTCSLKEEIGSLLFIGFSFSTF